MPDTEPKDCGTLPKTGDTYKCDGCGMMLKITADCGCTSTDPACAPCFKCCGKEMCKQC